MCIFCREKKLFKLCCGIFGEPSLYDFADFCWVFCDFCKNLVPGGGDQDVVFDTHTANVPVLVQYVPVDELGLVGVVEDLF